MRMWCLWLLLCLLPTPLLAQVTGVVTDAETGEPLPYVNIYYKHDKLVGTHTDEQGRYKITSNMARGELVFSYVGYQFYETTIRYGAEQKLDVRLTPLDKELAEVVVKPRKRRYKRKNNPAVELMRKVIAAKGENDLRLNRFVRYMKYQKMTFAFNGITQEIVDSGPLAKLPLLARQVEYCPQVKKHILPLTYNETLSEYLYRQSPKKERSYVRGMNEQGLNNLFSTGELVTTVLQSVFADVNIYDNSIHLLERPFTSPISSTSAISFYQYFIMDTTMVDGEKCINLSFVPQNPQDFGFSGFLTVLADSYHVKSCTINLPVRTAVNFVNNLVIEQSFAPLPNGQRTLVRDNMYAELGVVRKDRSLMVKRSTSYTNFSFDSIPPLAFKEAEQLREGTRHTEDETFWAQHRADTLTRAEAGMKDMLADAQRTRFFGPVMFIGRAFIENYVETAPAGKKNYVDIGPINTIFSTNFVEKYRVRASAQTTANLHPHLFFKGYAAYGFRDHRIKYEGEVEYSFLRKQYSPQEFPRHSITVGTRYDVMTPGDALSPRDKDNVFTSFKTQTVDHMMYLRNYRMKYEYEFASHLGLKAEVRHNQQQPLGALFYRTLSGRMIPKIHTTEATLAVRYSPGEKVINSKQRRVRVNNNAPVFQLSHTTGIEGKLGGAYRFNYTELDVYARAWLFSYGRIDVNVRAGAQWNQVPFPLLIMPATNNSYIITDHMFCMMNNLEFLTDRFASLDVQWDMSGKLFNRIPLFKRLKWREVIGFKALYGDLTSKNDPALHPGSDFLMEFPSRNGEPVSHRLGREPYMEFNVGIHNILKMFRIDYVHRLNYLHLPNTKRHGVRFCFQFDF